MSYKIILKFILGVVTKVITPLFIYFTGYKAAKDSQNEEIIKIKEKQDNADIRPNLTDNDILKRLRDGKL